MNIVDYKDCFKINNTNPWKGTPLENYYNLNPAAKGTKGEQFVESLLSANGYNVSNRIDAGHDRIVNNIKTEIKFALAIEANTNWECMFNHIGFNKTWEQILLVCVNGNGELRGVIYKKDNFPKQILSNQQGGNNSGNDDYLINSQHSYDVLFNLGGKIIF